METAVALYREWRPQTFGDLVGQEHVTKTLLNALSSGRVAHAYLFNGPRGTGKTSASKILAKAVNCERSQGEPCNECEACRGITAGRVMDVIEIDAASNRGVEEIRALREQVRFAPTEVSRKVYIVDEVHMLTTEAFNALLKTLEEPPAHAMFILATTEPHKLPATIISRCQRFDFKRMSLATIVGRLRFIAEQKNLRVEEEAFWLIARAADGGMRDALSLFDQLLSFSGDTITTKDILSMLGNLSTERLAEFTGLIAANDAAGALRAMAKLVDEGKDTSQIANDFLSYFRDLLMYHATPEIEEVKERCHYDPNFARTAEMFNVYRLRSSMQVLTDTLAELRYHTQGQLLLELAIMRLASESEMDPRQMMVRISELEKEVADLKGQMGIPKQQQNPPSQSVAVPRPAELPQTDHEQQANHQGTNQGHQPPLTLGFTVEDVRKDWNQVLSMVNRMNTQVAANLQHGYPYIIKSNKLVVAYKEQQEAHAHFIMKPECKTIIDSVLKDLAKGFPLEVYAHVARKKNT